MKITFFDTNETFNIMARDDRYIVCSRVYTIEESVKEANEWDIELKEYINDCFLSNSKFTEFEIYEDSIDYFEDRKDFIYRFKGERPTEFDENTQCYTLVDLQEQIRGADNYGNIFNYLDIKECKQALLELNRKDEDDISISRRNRVHLSEYKITDN